jgi:hypothetical protein
MNRDIGNGRMERELSRRELAMRMTSHRARTQTIERFTGLTHDQLGTMRRRAGVPTESRFRGKHPTSFDVFFSRARRRSESAVLAFLYRVWDASRFGKLDGSSEAAIARGEHLCEIFERWRCLVPCSEMEFEHLVLLGDGVTREDRIAFRHCDDCHAIILVDLLGTQRRLCDHCALAYREADQRSAHSGQHGDDEIDLVLYRYQLQAGLLLCEHQGRYTLDDGSFQPGQAVRGGI